MIWEHVDAAAFSLAYDGYLLGLEGAIARSVQKLRQRDPRGAIHFGQQAAVQAAMAARDQVMRAMEELISSAMTLGAQDAGSAPDPVALNLRQGQARSIVGSCFQMDLSSTQTTIRNQALVYDQAYRTMNHRAALLKATGDLNDDVFTQLDRRGHTLRSANMVNGFARLLAAQVYMGTFVEAALAAGQATALLWHSEREAETIDLNDAQRLKEAFHPNTRHRLQLLEAA